MKPSKKQKRERRLQHARRIADRQWWPGLHTRWWHIARNGHL